MIKVICLLQENLLIFTIEDYGVGRNYLKYTGTIPGLKKKSLGVKITEEQIKILSESSQTPAKVDFEDPFDKNHRPAGTRVHITIPFKT